MCREFVLLCREMNLLEEATVAVDGSKFKAVNNRDKNFTTHKLRARMQQLDESIAHYLAEPDRADRQPTVTPKVRVEHLKEKLATVQAQARQLARIEEQLEAAPDAQVSLTDPDARSMATSGRGTGMVGYNVQIAVDVRNHLIIEQEVTNQGHDRAQLEGMAKRSREALGGGALTVLADRGYYDGEQIRACEEAGIATLVPKPITSNSRAEGRFDKRDFVYDTKRDEYRCPAGERAIFRFNSTEKGMTIRKYWSSACPGCALQPRCTTSNYRRIARWELEAVLDRMQRRLDRAPQTARLRRQTVEHVFGTFKAWMGSTHFLTRTLPRVRTEVSLQVLAYNMKRAMTIVGVAPLLQAMRA